MAIQVHTACKNVGICSNATRIGSPAPCLCPSTAETHGENPPANGDRGRREETAGCTGDTQEQAVALAKGKKEGKLRKGEAVKTYSELWE